MTVLTFIIGAILFVTGFGSVAYSIDLVPTEMGRLYAECGVILISASGVVFAIAALIFKLSRVFAPPRRKTKAPSPAPVPAQPTVLQPAPEDDVNLNRSGHLPTLRTVEEAMAPEPAPHVVGRYAAGGTQYVIYSDGAIEAETEEGGLRFASMDELKSYIANRDI